MIASGVRGVRQAGGLRLMDPSRDLRQIADLIQESFAGEMGDAGMAAVRELRHMAYLAPLVWLMDRTSAEFRDAFTGFVWVEGGQIVGNVTLSRAKPASNRWHLSNVAVKEAYRGRGIGRQLVEAALELARARHGEWVVLQVRHDNEPALRIYRRLGFEALFAHTELYHSGILEEPWHAENVSGYRLRPRRPSDWRREYDLAMATTSEMQRWLQGIEISEYQRTPLQRFGEWIEDLLGEKWIKPIGD